MSAIATLGRVPSGIFILTIRHNGDETGMLASWVQQAGFEPPMVSVAVKQGRYVGEWIDAGEPFVLNLLSENQKSLLGHFGRGFEPGQPAFEGLNVTRTANDLPALADAMGHLVCGARGHVDSGDHRLYLAEVTGGELSRDDPPMIHVRKSGANY